MITEINSRNEVDELIRALLGHRRFQTIGFGCCLDIKVDFGMPQPIGDNSSLNAVWPAPYKMIAKLNIARYVDTKDPDALCGTRRCASKKWKRNKRGYLSDKHAKSIPRYETNQKKTTGQSVNNKPAHSIRINSSHSTRRVKLKCGPSALPPAGPPPSPPTRPPPPALCRPPHLSS
ncbi:hypothetical protein EVAR_21123_1 [Eumeta japonica]|uniref:Uncharacterized protein n=1 Tax=Eumeta variegata TaxID=151549 RepID=A0A4C1VV88_EUMVA|nr:hypothetical protein EVAR_21123_1 [Eumeta japonica]